MRGLWTLGGVALLLAVWPAEAEGWETLAEGVVVIRARAVAGHEGVREVWAEGELGARALQVQEVIRDHDSFWRWMPYVKESRVLETEPEGSRLTYSRVAPPVVSSRDYVCRAVDEQLLNEDGTGEFRQRWVMVEGVLPERKGVVRLRRNEGQWRVVPISDGRTHISYRFIVDPAGGLPGFLKSVGQKDGVLDTLRALERRAKELAQQSARSP